jgi:NADPH:quinone reductase-like Zn-dependent oxidoreductase
VVVSGATGSVGSLAVQLAKRNGATMIELASDSRREWLESHGVIQQNDGSRALAVTNGSNAVL